MRTLCTALVLVLTLTLGATAHASTHISNTFNYDFVPIAPLPAPGGGAATESASLGDYINAAFQIALGVGAALAVINIAIGGFEYMLSEAVTQKSAGKERITGALYGLLILLLVYLVLYVINPDILSLRFL